MVLPVTVVDAWVASTKRWKDAGSFRARWPGHDGGRRSAQRDRGPGAADCHREGHLPFGLRRLFTGRDLGDISSRTARIRVLDARQRPLALDDPERTFASLLSDELVERARLAHIRSDVRRNRHRHLALAGEPKREFRLLDGRDNALRLRHELCLAEPAGRLRRRHEPLRVLRPHVAVDPLLDRLGAELCDRVPRIDAFGTALIAEVTAGAIPDPVLVVIVLESLDGGLVTRVADEAKPLREGGRAEELGVGLHRVALGDAAAAHDAERLLVDHVHLLLGDEPLLLEHLVVTGLEPWLHPPDLVPETIHVHDEVLHDRHV